MPTLPSSPPFHIYSTRNPLRCGTRFTITKPALSRDQEAALIDVLKEILKDEETTIDRE